MTHVKYSVPNPFRERILKGQICSVMSCRYVITNEIAMMAKMAGIDGIFIDMEHSVITMREVSQLILACTYAGISPIVRIPSKAHWHLSRVLDAGAAAVVIPHCESVEEVKEIVKHAKFPPIGHRGCTNNQPLLGFQKVPTALQNELLNHRTMVIPMVETPSAIMLVDEFLAIEGVDGILVGSNDLCTDLGIPGQYDDQRYQNLVTAVVKAGVKAGKPIGIGGIAGRLDLLENWFRMGASWSLSGADGAILQAGMKLIGNKYININRQLQRERNEGLSKECQKHDTSWLDGN